MKVSYHVVIDHDPMKRLDLGRVSHEITDAIWEIMPELPRSAIKVTPMLRGNISFEDGPDAAA